MRGLALTVTAGVLVGLALPSTGETLPDCGVTTCQFEQDPNYVVLEDGSVIVRDERR